MAWRRGFFRLWLVATVAWVGFVGWIHYADYRDGLAYIERSSRVPVFCGQVRGEPGSDYGHSRVDPIGPWDRYKTDVNRFSPCWVRMASYRRLWPESASMTDQEVVNDGYKRIVQEQAPLLYDPADELRGAWNIALVPPAILFAIGLVIAWIVSGFRRPTA